MVLDLEHVVEPQAVGQSHLVEHLVIDAPLVFRVPLLAVGGFGQLQLVEEAELHRARPSLTGRRERRTTRATRPRSAWRRCRRRSAPGSPRAASAGPFPRPTRRPWPTPGR